MEETWESLFIKQAKVEHHSQAYINACLSYATNLRKKNLPVIFNTNHLALFLGLSISRYNEITINHYNCYSNYSIRKRHSKEKRKISAPHPDLHRAQTIIYKTILLKDTSVSQSAHGFIPKNSPFARGILSNALVHQGCSWLLNIDLKNFFPSIYYNRVFNYFFSLGYEKDVCAGLTKICTYSNSLPQGAPTSPMLSNLIAKELDKKCEDLALRKGCKYTRYADDLTFSGLDNSNKVLPKEVASIVSSCGFRVNRTKTKEKRRDIS